MCTAVSTMVTWTDMKVELRTIVNGMCFITHGHCDARANLVHCNDCWARAKGTYTSVRCTFKLAEDSLDLKVVMLPQDKLRHCRRCCRLWLKQAYRPDRLSMHHRHRHLRWAQVPRRCVQREHRVPARGLLALNQAAPSQPWAAAMNQQPILTHS